MSRLGNIFHFNRHDRDAIIVLLVVIVACIVLIPLLSDEENEKSPYGHYDRKGSLSYHDGNKSRNNKYFAQPDMGYGDGSKATTLNSDIKLTPFPFDPNTADSTTLLRLGLKAWQVRNIYKYRAKGGCYRKPSDFSRLYGLTAEQYKQLEPYIRIAAAQRIASAPQQDDTPSSRDANTTPVAQQQRPTPSYPRQEKISRGMTIDINTADTTELKKIPGIGSYFARKIVELRQRRGTFQKKEQLLSIRNFPAEALEYMSLSNSIPMIRLNSMTQKELQAHPLLNYVQARDIINLRRSIGKIKTIQDLSLIKSIPADLLQQLLPHLTYE